MGKGGQNTMSNSRRDFGRPVRLAAVAATLGLGLTLLVGFTGSSAQASCRDIWGASMPRASAAKIFFCSIAAGRSIIGGNIAIPRSTPLRGPLPRVQYGKTPKSIVVGKRVPALKPKMIKKVARRLHVWLPTKPPDDGDAHEIPTVDLYQVYFQPQGLRMRPYRFGAVSEGYGPRFERHVEHQCYEKTGIICYFHWLRDDIRGRYRAKLLLSGYVARHKALTGHCPSVMRKKWCSPS